MRRITAILTIAVISGVANSQPPVPRLPEEVRAPKTETYHDAFKRAEAAKQHAIIYVGAEAHPPLGPYYGAVAIRADAYSSVPGVYVILHDGKKLESSHYRFPLGTDADTLQSWLSARSEVRAASPFPQIAQHEELAALPVGDDDALAFLQGMEQYRTARYSQVSFNRSGRGMNSLVERSSLAAKWSVPGGLEGVRGWTNQLYRAKTNRVRNWFGHVDPNDSPAIGVWGSEIIHQRQYDDGAKFADVLRTDRGIFEVRVAEMQGGEWRRSIPYRNPSAEPAGYVRVSLQKCAACHDQAGDGGYGSARIPGGGGVISEPFPALE